MTQTLTARRRAALGREAWDQMEQIARDWADHTPDREFGGYHTNFGPNWETTGSDKNIWAQARQLDTFSALAIREPEEPRWLELARLGRDFLVEHAYAGNGRWCYQLDRTGRRVVEGATSLFTDLFLLGGLSAYVRASGDQRDMPLLEATLRTAGNALFDPEFRDLKPRVWRPGVWQHSPFMIAVRALETARPVLGDERVEPLLRRCVDQVLGLFPANPSGLLLENMRADGSFWDTPEGRLVDPGHTFEGLWFCLDTALRWGDQTLQEEIFRLGDRTARAAWDAENGGFFLRLDCFGGPPVERELPADQKVDWVQAEAYCYLAMAAALRGEPEDWRRFLAQKAYVERWFRPAEGGDWYPRLSRENRVLARNKGGKHRAAFHVPRALLHTALVFGAA